MPLFKAAFKKKAGRQAADAAFAGNFDQAFALIDKGGNINTLRWIDGDDASALDSERGGEGNIGYAAIRHGNLAALQKALDLGLDPNLKSPYRSPLLVFAILNKREDAALLLLDRGAETTGYLLADNISPLALAHMHRMAELVRRIESKLSPPALEDARQAHLPWGVKPAKKQEKKPGRFLL